MSSSTNISPYSVVCYFCNESFPSHLFQDHLHLCESILQKCPNKCGVYIPRKALKSHDNHCINLQNPQTYSLPRNFRMDMDKKESTYRDKVLSLLTLLRSAVKEGENERKEIMKNANLVSERLETIESTTKSFAFDLSENSEKTWNSLGFFRHRLNIIDSNLARCEASTRASFDAVLYRLDVVQGGLIDQKNKQAQVFADCDHEIKELKKFVAEESLLIGDIWDDQKKRMNDLKLELEMRCKKSKEIELKWVDLVEKIEKIEEAVRKQAEIIEKQEKSLKNLKFQVKDVIKYVEDLIFKDMDANLGSSKVFQGSSDGRLLWRIDNYKEKMSLAKENDMVLRSPRFFSKTYGYCLRMKLFLNGRDRWRDRNVIGCLQVVEGPWDPLLEWPCILRATVTLRDQDNPANNVKKIVKTKGDLKGGFGGEEGGLGERDSVIDMFIPHSLLTRYDGFVKNNVLFLDIQVTELRGSSSMSSLIA